MKLIAKKAVELSIELWEWLAETGEDWKDYWPKWKENGGKYPAVSHDCFLCEYAGFKTWNKEACKSCPYFIKYKARCYWENKPFGKWECAYTDGDKKKYAKQFLKQLKTLLEEAE